LARENKIDEVISIGDITDQHTTARFLRSPNAEGTKREWYKAREVLKRYQGELGLSKVVIGNHDTRLIKRSREGGLPDEWLKPLDEIYGLKDVEFAEEFIIDEVCYIHGVSGGGESGWQDYCKKNGMSTVIGHFHSIGGIRYHTQRDGSVLFSLATGCGVNKDAYAFEYAKGNPKVPVIGAGIVYGKSRAYFEPFDPTDRRNSRRD